MTYNIDEASVYNGRPIELYAFAGTFVSYYYTSHNEDVIYEGQRYTAKPIKRSRLKITTPSAGNSDLTIDLPADDPLILSYAFGVAPPDLELTLIRYHTPDDIVIYWRGNVTNVRVAGNIGQLISPNEISRAMAGEIPSIIYQTPCNNVLGDPRCGVDLEALKHLTYMTSYDPAQFSDIEVQSVGGRPNDYFTNGVFQTPFETRPIKKHVGTVLTLAYPLTQRKYRMPVTIFPGCNLSFTGDCRDKFSNQVNFGGYPYIPNINPFVSGIG